MNKLPRCILVFQNATKSEGTYKSYLYNLDRFRKHFKIKDFGSLLEIDSKKITSSGSVKPIRLEKLSSIFQLLKDCY